MPTKPDTDIEIPPEVATYISELEETNDELNTALSEHLSKSDDDEDDKTSEDGDDTEDTLTKLLSKAADDETRALIEKAISDVEVSKAAAEEAQNIAKAERDKRLDREFIAKAAEFESLPGVAPAEFGPILKSASESLSKEHYEKLTEVLTAANEVATQGSLFKEMGQTGAELTDDSDLSKAAAKIMTEEGVDKFTAIAKAVEADPSLYETSRKGN